MREFKFRVWHGDEMLYEVESVGVDEIGPYFQEDVAGDRYYCNALMQSTGLKDVNSMEIYDGDIVKFNPKAPDSPGFDMIGINVTGEVFFSECRFWVDCKDHAAIELFHGIDQCEIIGNKFENEDLLK